MLTTDFSHKMNSKRQLCLVLFSLTLLISVVSPKKADSKEKPQWAKKDIRDFDEADMERLLDQWEEDEEPLPEDELPEHKRKPPPVPDFNFDKGAYIRAYTTGVYIRNSNVRELTCELTMETFSMGACISTVRFTSTAVGSMSPEEILKLTKKGKTLMMFVNLNGNPSKHESETLTSFYQGALRNNHIQAERYVIDDARAIFLFQDGAQAWEAKEFLLEQEGVDSVTLENQQYPGKHKKPDGAKSNSKSSTKSEL